MNVNEMKEMFFDVFGDNGKELRVFASPVVLTL